MLNYRFKPFARRLLTTACAMGVLSASSSALATIVVIETSQGNIEVNLFDKTTPKTVANFLTYVNEGDYINTVIHRSEPNFVVQGGGFTFDGELPLKGITTRAAVKNEPVWSNRRGTVAMAKLGGRPDSATSQWFFNLRDNHAGGAALDSQNGGFTTFGQVTDEGMKVVDKIAALNRCNSSTMQNIPMPNFECSSGNAPSTENFVSIISVTITDATVDTAADLTLVKNTANDKKESDSSGGGSTTGFGLMALALAGLIRRKKSV